MSTIVNLTLLHNRAKIKPAQFLDGNFMAYKKACEAGNAWYDHNNKTNACELEMVPGVIETLRQAGFQPQVSQELADAVKAKAVKAMTHVDAARERIRAIQENLKTRGLQLFPFQEEGVPWLASKDSAILGDEMGLGKTVQALIALPTDAPVIIICPAALKGNWRNEIRKWRPDLEPVIYSGRGSWRWPVRGQAVIINYDILPEEPEKSMGVLAGSLFEEGHACQPGTVLIADECHGVKNSKAKRTERFRAISKIVRTKGGKTWGLTGTPLINRAQELWNVLHAFDLANKAFGNWKVFCKVMGGYQTAFGYEFDRPLPAAAEMLRTVMLKRDRMKVLPDLPTKLWRVIEVEIDRETEKLCDHVEQKIMNEVGADIKAVLEDEQIAFEDIARVRAALATAKIPAMLERIEDYEEEEQPVVVFSAHRAPIDTLETRDGWATITGDTPPEKRSELVDAFQGGRLKGLGITIKAGGVGLTLTRAHECLFVDLEWTPALNTQAEDRLCRIGQTRGVMVTILAADHAMDRRVTELLMEKSALIRDTVDKAALGKDQAPTLPNDKPLQVDIAPIPSDAIATPQSTPAGVGLRQKPEPTRQRLAVTPMEQWARDGLLRVAGLDWDGARQTNGCGFSKYDSEFGRKMAEICKTGRATDRQWEVIVRMAVKYRRQIGEPPK